jgi:antitoxin component of MazEF toxin-antitoxin module
MFNTKKVEILRKKIDKLGTSKAITLPAHWLNQSGLTLKDTVELIVTENYLLIKDCRNPIMNELLNDEVVLLYNLEKLRNEKVVQAQEWFKKAEKELDSGPGESIGFPLFSDRKIDVNEKTAWMLELSPQERAILRQGWTELLKISEDLEKNLSTKK